MIEIYSEGNNFSPQQVTAKNKELLSTAVWIDLLSPSEEEAILVEDNTGLEIPTKKEMQEIELSSRLYKEKDALYMTVNVIVKSETTHPKSDPMTLILTKKTLITIRYINPPSFELFIARLSRRSNIREIDILLDWLDISIDRLADILENISHRLESYSQVTFSVQKDKFPERPDFQYHLQDIGASGDLSTKVQESLITFSRLISFFNQNISPPPNPQLKAKLTTLTKDINSLTDYVIFLSNKVNFLLDATLGMINIEQNNIIKIFSIASVILLPPTLIASIYGMNFTHMPELSWRLGYPFAILLMAIAAWLPYKFFKKKKWL